MRGVGAVAFRRARWRYLHDLWSVSTGSLSEWLLLCRSYVVRRARGRAWSRQWARRSRLTVAAPRRPDSLAGAGDPARWLGFYEAVADRDQCELGLIRYTEFLFDVVEM